MIPLFAFSEDIRRVICTTNATPISEYDPAKVTRNHSIFPSDEDGYKVICLAMRNITAKWTMPICDKKPARGSFALEFAERFPK